MFERLNGRAGKVVIQAREEALRRGDPEIAPGHLLLAMAVVRQGPAYRALKALDFRLADGRRALNRAAGLGTGAVVERFVPVTAEALRDFQRAEVLADTLFEDRVDTGHLLVCLLEGGHGEVAGILELLEIPPKVLRSEAFRRLQERGPLSRKEFDRRMGELSLVCRSADPKPQLDRLSAQYAGARRGRDWERSARLAAVVAELHHAAHGCHFDDWKELARAKLSAVLRGE